MESCIIKATSPVILSSEVVEIAEGATAPADSYGLTNNTDQGIWVDRVSFSLRHNSSVGTWWLGATMNAKLRVGMFEITNGFVPICGMQDRFSPAGVYSSNYYATDPSTTSTHRMNFTYPIYLPPGMGINAMFSRGADAVVDPFSVGAVVSFGGKFTTDKPTKTAVPYIAAFASPDSVSNATSENTQLQNPFRVPMFIDKFIGNGHRSGPAILVDSDFTVDGNLVDIQFRGSRPLTSAPMPFQALFRNRHYELPVKMEIEPRDWFIVRYTDIQSNIRLVTSMIGYREESL